MYTLILALNTFQRRKFIAFPSGKNDKLFCYWFTAHHDIITRLQLLSCHIINFINHISSQFLSDHNPSHSFPSDHSPFHSYHLYTKSPSHSHLPSLFNPIVISTFYRSSRPELFCRKGVLRNFAKFTGKHLCQSVFFNKVAPATLLKKRLWHRSFPVNFAKFLRTPFLTEHIRWLLLLLANFFSGN